MIPLIGFAPDLPPETPGVITDCSSILPGLGEFVAAPSGVDAGLGALSGSARGFAVVRKNDSTNRAFAGASDKLYESAAGAWDDKSKVGGYTLGPDNRWRFAQFGNTTLAAAKTETIQAITSGDFANLSASAPKAAIVETVGNQVFAFDTNDATFGDDPERWWCSALGDATDWTPAVATQCVSGQLLGASGPITAGRRLGDVIVAYKERAMFVGQYVGAPAVWDFRMVPGNIGAPSHECVVTTGTAHYFVGPDDFYMFDGSRPVPLNSPLREWFYDTLDTAYAYRICGSYDQKNQRVFWWFASTSSGGVLDKCVVLNIKTGQWGRMDGNIEIAAEYVTPGISYDTLGTEWTNYDDLPTTLSYDSPFWNASGSVLSAFRTDHIAYTYSGTPGASVLVTGHHGDNQAFSTVSRLKPRFILSPITSQLLYSHSNTDASAFTQNLTSTWAYGWYDVLWSAQWHKFELQFTGNMKISGYDLTISPDGQQ
jgi:hypothetical protein